MNLRILRRKILISGKRKVKDVLLLQNYNYVSKAHYVLCSLLQRRFYN
jgi:hypothetical protein